jgi:hypothetical protein
MRTIIAGSRDFTDYEKMEEIMGRDVWKVSVVISGTARGADRLGERWAKENGIPVERFPAAWKKYGKKAGYMRNIEMADAGEALVAFWDGETPGTESMIKLARIRAMPICIHRLDKGLSFTHMGNKNIYEILGVEKPDG